MFVVVGQLCWMLVVGSIVLYSHLRYVPYFIDTGAFVSFVGSFYSKFKYKDEMEFQL